MRNQCAVGVEVHQQQLTIAATRTADRSSTLNRRLILCTMIAHPPQSHMQHAASRHTFKFFFPFSARMRTTSCPHPSILHAKDGTRGAHAPSRKRAEGWSLLFGRQAAGNGKQKPMTQRAPNMRAGACKEKKKHRPTAFPTGMLSRVSAAGRKPTPHHALYPIRQYTNTHIDGVAKSAARMQ